MDEIIQEKYGSFIKDIKKLSYILNDNQLFSLNQYKICNNQTQDLFVKCQRIQHNGKVKVLYFIEEYENIFDVLKKIDENDYYKICENLIHAMIQVEDNGFLDIHNVIVEPDMVYVEKETLKVKLIYIPITIASEKVIDIDNNIKNVLAKIVDRNLYPELWDMIQNNNLEQLQNWLQQKSNIKELDGVTGQSADYEEESFSADCELQSDNPKGMSDSKGHQKTRKMLGGAIAIVLLGFGMICCAAGLNGEKRLETEAAVTPTLTPTPTATPTPTVTPVPEPTATPTPTVMPTSEPTATPKPRKKQQAVESTPVPDNPVQSNPLPPQTQPNAVIPPNQNNNPEQSIEDDYEDLDEFIIVQ